MVCKLKSFRKVLVAASIRLCVTTAALCFGALYAGAVTIDSNTKLLEDTSYLGQGAVTIAADVTLDLNGNKLFVDGLDGAGTITDTRDYDLLEHLTFKADDIYTGQKIHLGITPLSSDRLEMRFILPESLTSANYALWCARGANGAGTYTCFVQKSTNTIRYDYNATLVCTSDPFSMGSAVHTVVFDPAAGARALDGVVKNDLPKKDFTVGSEIVIGVSHNALDNFAWYGSFRVCGFTVTGSDGVLKHDFVPVRRCSDGAVGLLDRKTGDFRQNSGNSAVPLAAGPVVPEDVGELHVVVPDNCEARLNDGVTLSGSLRLVKEGAGTVVLGTMKQYNTGGWEIAAGTVKPTDDVYRCQSFGVLYSKVIVRTGATYDMDGQKDSRFYDFVLDGGTIANTGADINSGFGCVGKVTLTKNSTFNVKSTFPLWDIVDLNGCTLDVDISNDKYLILDVDSGAFANGTVNIKSGGWLQSWVLTGGLRDMKTADFIVGSALSLQSDIAVRNLTATCESTNADGSGKVKIYGVFTPTSDYVNNFVLQDGATLNLADRRDAYNLKSSLTGKTLGFAEGSTINIALGARVLENGMKLISWDDASAPLPTVSFKLPDEVGDAFMLVSSSDGLYVAMAVKTATWTGEADTTCTNPANWICKDADGNVIVGARPGNITAVILSGSVQLDIPANPGFSCASFTCDNMSLKGDCDWSGINPKTIIGTVELNGHKLYMRGLEGTWACRNSLGYDLLEHLTFKADDLSTGQKIHLGITPLSSDRLEMRFILPESLTSAHSNYALWCARGANGAGTYTCFVRYIDQNSPNTIRYDYNATLVCASDPFSAGSAVHTVVFDPAAGTRALDGVVKNDLPKKDFTVGSEIVIGVSHNALDNFAWYGSFRVCGFTVTGSDGALKHDFVPVRRCSDDAIGLLDRVTGDFRQNSGNSAVPLAAGPVVGNTLADGVGELHIVVPNDGVAHHNDDVTLFGSLRLVKEGDGTMLLSKTKQYNSGGWEIAAGTVKPTDNAYRSQSFGVLYSKVIVRAGATYDMNGQCDSRYYDFVLDGGTIANTGSDINPGYGCMGKVTLTKNSALKVKSSFSLFDVVDLNGYTLDVDIDNDKYLTLDQFPSDVKFGTFENGTVNIKSGGWFRSWVLSGGLRDMKTVDFIVGSALSLRSDFAVRNLTAACKSANVDGTGKVNVYGVFTPASDYINNFVLQDGATLNLADRSGAYDLKSSLTGQTLGFAEGVPTVQVALGDRKVRGGEQVVAWEAGSKPNVKFRPAAGAKCRLSAKDDGLYVEKGFTLVIR